MPIEVYWDNEEKTIIRADFDAQWTWDEYNESIDVAITLNVGITHRIHQLIDMRKTRSVPSSAIMPHLMRSRRTDPENLGATVIIAAPKILEIFVNVIEKAYKTRFPKRWMVQTLEEAYAQIEAFEAQQVDNPNPQDET